MIKHVDPPVPEALVPEQLTHVGISAGDLADIRAVVAAYNRSNGMNLTALAAMIAKPVTAPASSLSASSPSASPPSFASSPSWPQLPPLLARQDIAPETWSLIRQVNALGATGPDAHVATLWRHLAHWPGFLAMAHAGLAPLQASGAITAAQEAMVHHAARAGASMEAPRPELTGLSDQARETISDYVTIPTQVAHGHDRPFLGSLAGRSRRLRARLDFPP